MSLIIYIHVCQINGWKPIFESIISKVKNIPCVVRIGIATDKFEDHTFFHDSRVQLLPISTPSEFERPTLLHLRSSSFTDDPSTMYCYVHTKGVSHVGKTSEGPVKDWTDLCLYWNLTRYEDAIEMLKRGYTTYGCLYKKGFFKWAAHYSGNIWWMTCAYAKTLQPFIGARYVDPEFWCMTGKPRNPYNAFDSGMTFKEHYLKRLPPYLYSFPGTMWPVYKEIPTRSFTAYYGIPGKQVQVALPFGETVSVNNTLAADPARNVRKRLLIQFQWQGVEYASVTIEGQCIYIP